MITQLHRLKVKKLHPDAKLPTKNYESDACFDLYSNQDCEIDCGETKKISTDIAIELPKGYAGFIWDRSGLGSKGIHRFAGVIDESFRGPIQVILCNLNIYSNLDSQMCYIWEQRHYIKRHDRIAQLFIQRVEPFVVEEVEELSETERGEKGWGSSGK